jgi:CheY-like chemotaxis protein
VVRDTGIGIPPDKQRLIFEPFTQADGSTTRRYGGTGLGLTITQQLVELMQGQLWLESTVGQGSSFHFTIGLERQAPAERRPEWCQSERVRGVPVLIVDDNATQRRLLHTTLSHWGMRPTAVNSGRAARDALKRAQALGTPFPLVLLDASLPDTDGFTLAAQLTQRPTQATAIIMLLTSRCLRDDARRCQELGPGAFLIKPIAHAALWQAIAQALRAAIAPTWRSPVVVNPPRPEPSRLCRVLLAEDNTVNQRLAVRLLEKWGYTVVAVGTGRAVLEKLAQEPFDLVLMDLQMPDMDGLEATTAVREQERDTMTHIPIIAMTAHAMPGDAERCLAMGMDGYVAKPVKPADLHAAIKGVLGTRALPIRVSGRPLHTNH